MRSLALLFILTIVSSLNAQAFVIDSRVAQSDRGYYFQEMTLLCEFNETQLCSAVCNDPLVCQSPEPLCLNCAGTSNELLRVIFSRLNWYFEANPNPLSLKTIAQFLSQSRYVILGSDSIYNFYRPHDAPDIRHQFNSLCPVEPISTHLAVELNNRGEPTRLAYVFCAVSSTVTHVYSIEPKQNNQPPQLMRKN